MFTNTNELSGLVAAQINADKLIILSNVEGVFSDHPSKPGAKLISEIHPQETWPEVSNEKSIHGRGGMFSKLGTARKMSDLGITTHIASIDTPLIIKRIIEGESLGTRILSLKKKSNINRWMVFNSDKNVGTIHINARLFELLKEGKRAVKPLLLKTKQ